MNEPLSSTDARQLIRRIVADGIVVVSGHAEQEMDNDDLTMPECVAVLKGGWVDPAEFECGSWRYRVCTTSTVVVVAFISDTELVVVTAWRVK